MYLVFIFIFFITCITLIKPINSYDIEICDRFDIVHNFDNCPTGSPVEECANQGTWEHTMFVCTDPGSEVEDGNYCEYGRTKHDDCCTIREIHYIDFWFEIVGGSTWQVNFFNFLVKGYSDGPFKGNIVLNDVVFEDLYTVSYDNLTFISVILDYGSTCETTMFLYINGVYMANITTDDVLDISPFTSLYVMEMTAASSNHLHFIGAHQRIPTSDKIMELYNLGGNRSISTELCYNITSSTIDDLISTIDVLELNLTNCQNYTVYLEGELEECNDLLNQCNASLIECEGNLNDTLEDCLDIIICLEANLTKCQNYTDYLEGELVQCNDTLNETQEDLTQCNDTLNETQEDLTQCNDTLNEIREDLTQCNDTLNECDDCEECEDSETIIIELRRNLTLCINETQYLEMLLMEAYINTQSWIIAFIVIGSIFLISILGYISWWIILPCLIGGGKKKRRRKRREKRRKYKEEEEMEMSLFK